MKILGVHFDNLNKEEALKKIREFLADGAQHFIVLPYAEFLVKAQEDEEFKKILNRADLCLAEGFGVIFGSYILGQPLKGRVIGVKLVEAVVKEFGQNNGIFFFGAKEGVAAKAAEKLEQKFSGVKSVETLNGFVSDEEAINKINGIDPVFCRHSDDMPAGASSSLVKINEAKPEILLVGLGMPKQEKWIIQNLKKLPSIKLAIGVGGAFDFLSGRVKRAPIIFQKLGLEWFWRLIIQPWRVKKIFRSVAIFLWFVIKEKMTGNYQKVKKIHFIGIGGIGISALVQYFLAQGAQVSGSDVTPSEITEFLAQKGVKISIGHQPKNLPADTDLVVYSAAIEKDNPELTKARELGISMKSYAEELGELTKKMFAIGICGMHGKSTTTAMLAKIMEKAGLDPTVIVGSKVRDWTGGNFRQGKSQYFLIEADEYDASFLNYWPRIIVLLNIEEEHLDYYRDLNHILETFKKFIFHLPEGGILVANEEDENINKLISNFPACAKASAGRQFPISKQIQNSKFKIQKFNSKIKSERLNLKVPGEYNISNAMAALTAARALGISDEISIEALNEFSGIWRRMEYRGELNGSKIFDDYGHHPTEIKATLAGAKELLAKSDKRQAIGDLWCVFQPHQYQRLYKLFDKFVGAFDQADKLILLPVFSVPGRESDEIKSKTSSEKLALRLQTQDKSFGFTQDKPKEVIYLDSFEKAVEYLKNKLKKGDICVVMGAGDIYQLSKKLI